MKNEEEIDEVYKKLYLSLDDSPHYHTWVRGYTQCQEDMARKEIQPEDIWNKENQEKIKEHILNQARKQTTEDILETELAAKKYTLEDIENAFNSGRGYGVPDNIKDFNSFINSLNKQD